MVYSGRTMASITIDKIDDSLQRRLSSRAAAHGRSLADEARDILNRAVKDDPEPEAPERENIGLAFRRRFAEIGGWEEFEPPPRGPMREPPKFD